jgi:hypothetical protein
MHVWSGQAFICLVVESWTWCYEASSASFIMSGEKEEEIWIVDGQKLSLYQQKVSNIRFFLDSFLLEDWWRVTNG